MEDLINTITEQLRLYLECPAQFELEDFKKLEVAAKTAKILQGYVPSVGTDKDRRYASPTETVTDAELLSAITG